MATAYEVKNTESRQRLIDIVNQLTNEQLAQPVGSNGWTVAAYLGHLAFWDARAALLLRKWKKEGLSSTTMDVDIVNQTMQRFFLALPAGAAAKLAMDSAAEIDLEIESLGETWLLKVEADGKTVRLDRSAHRVHHLAQIEKALGLTL